MLLPTAETHRYGLPVMSVVLNLGVYKYLYLLNKMYTDLLLCSLPIRKRVGAEKAGTNQSQPTYSHCSVALSIIHTSPSLVHSQATKQGK